MNQKHFTDKLADVVANDATSSKTEKEEAMRGISKLKETKVNILITGATGSGKSSTINALFKSEKAKVGQGVDPETMEIAKYDLDNLSLFDSPGLGDGTDADLRHAEKITSKLKEKDHNGAMLIDLVLVILDGGSKDLGTSFDLINNVIIPNLGDDKKRLLVAINQADMAMKRRYWNIAGNFPEPELVKLLSEKVVSTRKRIGEATGVYVEPIYYVAGYKDGDNIQNPYNLSKLLLCILKNIKKEKRAVFIPNINTNELNRENTDPEQNYREEVESTLWDSLKSVLSDGVKFIKDLAPAIFSFAKVFKFW